MFTGVFGRCEVTAGSCTGTPTTPATALDDGAQRWDYCQTRTRAGCLCANPWHFQSTYHGDCGNPDADPGGDWCLVVRHLPLDRGESGKQGGLTREVETPLRFKQPTWPYDVQSGPGGLTREVETPLPSNSPHGHMILRVDLVGSHGRWKRPCLHTAHMAI